MDYKLIGARIKEERTKLGLTQDQISEDIGISTSYFGYIERGERSYYVDILVRIANRLGVSVDYLLADTLDNKDSALVDEWLKLTEGCSVKTRYAIIDTIKTLLKHLR